MFTSADYDKLRQLTKEKPEYKELIEKLLSSHEEEISSISHEIRNPLTLVYSTLQLIESRHPEVTSFQYWDSMRQDIEYMKQLLEELSSLNHSASLFPSSFSFQEFMEQLVLSFAASVADSPVEFTSCIAPDLPVIYADRIKLREVFLNLLKNAAEAISSDGTIRLDAFLKSGCVCVKIADSGCGIPSSRLDSIFQPFVTYKYGGTGLGLAIVKRTVDAHHGTILVESSPDNGTVFLVSLPV